MNEIVFLSDEAQPIAPPSQPISDAQKQIASETIARIIAEACDSRDTADSAELVELAVSAADALVAGFSVINKAI